MNVETREKLKGGEWSGWKHIDHQYLAGSWIYLALARIPHESVLEVKSTGRFGHRRQWRREAS